MWVWRQRYEELGARPDVDYVLIFENRGVEVGTTLHHPHGQIYAFPFLPPVPRSSSPPTRGSAAAPRARCSQRELDAGERVIYENDASRGLRALRGALAV